MDSFNIKGRGLRDTTTTEEAHVDRYSVRIDDAKNPEFWLELEIPSGKLIEMLLMILAVRGELHNGHLTTLRTLREQLKRVPADR